MLSSDLNLHSFDSCPLPHRNEKKIVWIKRDSGAKLCQLQNSSKSDDLETGGSIEQDIK